MNWELATQIAQVIATILTGVGVIVSVWIGISTVRETRADRIQSVKPKLLFDRGGQMVQCDLVEANGIPGIDFTYASTLLKHKPPGTKSCKPKTSWNRLTNHGNGSAINTSVTFLTQKVEKAGESFFIDDIKLFNFPYSPDLNRIPATPSNIPPRGTGEFFRIPTPVFVDFTGQLTLMYCVAVLDYEDVFGTKYQTLQELRVHIERTENEAQVTLTFSEEVALSPEIQDILSKMVRKPKAKFSIFAK
jgi:hypothetical protein